MTGATCSPSMYYELTNIHRQCYACNVHKSGNWVNYLPFMERKYGKKHVKWLLNERGKLLGEKWTYKDFEKKYNDLKKI